MRISNPVQIIFLFLIIIVSGCNENDHLNNGSPTLPAEDSKDQQQAIFSLIDQYVQARETKDTVLLKNILTTDMDQLVSSGTWRVGIEVAVKGMLQSSTRNPGTRTIEVDKIRFLTSDNAIADARYEIQNSDRTVRKMWSTFVVVRKEGKWKITAIRNMLPSGN